MSRLRLATALLVLLAVDLAGILVAGRASLLALGGAVGPWGFVARAAALAALVVWRFGLLPSPDRRMETGRLVLLVLLFPTLVQFQILGARLKGDGVSYYVFVRSLLKDRDFDLVDEYGHYGMLTRWDLAVTTRTGLRRSIYAVGPAVVWTPFFLVGEAAARLEGALSGVSQDLSGYGRHYVNAVALGNVLYGFGALLLIHAVLQRYFPRGIALGAVLLLWGATFVHWYLVVQPTYAHSPSMFLAAYALWLWDRDRESEGEAWGAFFLGAVLGLGMCVRWQNGVLLLLPGLGMAARLLRRPADLPRIAARGGLLALGVLLGAFPQMCAWKALYDAWLLPCPPQGCDFVRLYHPWILETLFSSRHGLLSWTPALWAGYLGFVPLARRRPALAATLAAPLVVMTYVNMCVGDWWGGASFSNRRFDSVLPLLAFGVAAALAAVQALLRRRPILGVAAVVLPFVAWGVAADAALRQGLVTADPTVPFPRIVGGAARAVSNVAGFPTTWPASWLFAWQHRVSPGRYDLTVGRYLFYRQNSIGQRVDLADPDLSALLDGGWRPPEIVAGRRARCITTAARVFVPLDVPEAFELRFEVAGPDGARQAGVSVNGRPLGSVVGEAAWGRVALKAPAGLWHREINELTLEPQEGSGPLCVAGVEFIRTSKRGRHR